MGISAVKQSRAAVLVLGISTLRCRN